MHEQARLRTPLLQNLQGLGLEVQGDTVVEEVGGPSTALAVNVVLGLLGLELAAKVREAGLHLDFHQHVRADAHDISVPGRTRFRADAGEPFDVPQPAQGLGVEVPTHNRP